MRVAAGGLVQSAAGVTDQRPAVYKLCAAVYKRGAAAHKVLARWCTHTRYLSIKEICGGAMGVIVVLT